MKLTSDAFNEAFRLFTGKVLSPAHAVSYAERLDSVEECLAWLLLCSEAKNEHSWLLAALTELADTQVATAQTRRKESNFPRDEERTYQALDEILHALLNVDKDASSRHEEAHSALVSFAQVRPVECAARHSLGIAT